MCKNKVITKTLMLEISRVRELYWDQGLNAREVAKRLDISVWSLYNLMEKNSIPRRSQSEVSYLLHKDKPRFVLKTDLDIAGEQLKVAGIMLYWAEGARKGSTVDFANSDPRMVRIFLKFLRDICGVKEERLRVYLYAYSYSKIDEIKEYWHKLTGIPLSRFTKPYIRTGHANVSKRKLPYGLVHIRYNDTKLLEKIGGWINEYIEELR